MPTILVWWLNSLHTNHICRYTDLLRRQPEANWVQHTYILLINFPSIHCCTAWRKIPTCSTKAIVGNPLRITAKQINPSFERETMNEILPRIYLCIVRSNLRAVFSSHQKFRFLKVALIETCFGTKEESINWSLWIAYCVCVLSMKKS